MMRKIPNFARRGGLRRRDGTEESIISIILNEGWANAVIKIPRYVSRYFGSAGVPYHGNLKILCFYRYRVSRKMSLSVSVFQKISKNNFYD